MILDLTREATFKDESAIYRNRWAEVTACFPLDIFMSIGIEDLYVAKTTHNAISQTEFLILVKKKKLYTGTATIDISDCTLYI